MSWSNPQKALVKAYQRYAGIADQHYRNLLRVYTGRTTSTAPALTQPHFDAFMAIMETYADLAHRNGRGVGKVPSRLTDWHYWRRRNPANARQPNRRLLWKIDRLWTKLLPYLAPEQQAATAPGDSDRWYLHAIAHHATGRHVRSIADLRRGDALVLIEALKDRLAHAIRPAA